MDLMLRKAKNCGPHVIMDLLEYSKIPVAMDMYAHVLPALQNDAAQALNKLLTGRYRDNKKRNCMESTIGAHCKHVSTCQFREH